MIIDTHVTLVKTIWEKARKKRYSTQILTKDNFLKKDSTFLSGASLNRLRFPSAQWQEMSLGASLGPEL